MDPLGIFISRCDAPCQLRGDLYIALCRWCGRGAPFVTLRYHDNLGVNLDAVAAWNAALSQNSVSDEMVAYALGAPNCSAVLIVTVEVDGNKRHGRWLASIPAATARLNAAINQAERGAKDGES